MNKKTTVLFVVLLSLLLAGSALAGNNWTTYVPAGQGISISFAQVNAKTWTWSLRNDTGRTVSSIEFTYSYIDADTGQYKTDKDMEPFSLEPGKSKGGWTAFTCNSRSRPTITITKVNFKR